MKMDTPVMALIPAGHFKKIKQACELRGESISGFGRRTIFAEMIRMGLLPPDGKPLLEA